MKKILLALSVVLSMIISGCGAGSDTSSSGASISVQNVQNCGAPGVPMNNCQITLNYSTGGVGGLVIGCSDSRNVFAPNPDSCNPPVNSPAGILNQCSVSVPTPAVPGSTGSITCSISNGGSTVASTAPVSVHN